jgi:hypothetical protein
MAARLQDEATLQNLSDRERYAVEEIARARGWVDPDALHMVRQLARRRESEK